ncbi:MAG: PorT family protein [Bacteroidales bacterium]|nr:PorT family protein [Bacteroidales bacterium]MCF8403298.1 PorT family protein [Bacteroidales bacterium]
MKNILLLALLLVCFNSFSQVVDEETKRKFTFGLDLFTDIWQETPKTLEPRTLNPGVNIFGSYNYIFGESNVSFSPGLGLSVHNLFSKSRIGTNSDSSFFEVIPDDISFKRSKFTTTYLDIPLELRYKSKAEFRLAVGFKFGFLINAQTKFKGDDFINDLKNEVIIKQGNISFLEKNRYGFTGRIGYKWLNIWGYYQLSSTFVKGSGPDMYPISVGITIIPF